MCGICGYVGIEEEGLLEAMTASLAHRGPDDAGFLRGPQFGFGHRRLSIIDLAGGHQPIANEDESAFIMVNGEIYDHRALREELLAKGHRLRTQSDSEVFLHLWEDLGPAALQRINGMFAIALWEPRSRRLFLARDRLGIKPLYYAQVGRAFLFASESKALLRWRGLDPQVDPRAVHDYLALRYVPGPGGMLQGIKKLPAGHWALVEDGRVHVERYWKPELHSAPSAGTDEEWLEGYAERFERSIRRRLVAEVPLGAYLSGGLDSSTIVSAIAEVSPHPVQTFTVGFDYQHDELSAAARTAQELGCDHTEIACRVSDVELLPKLVWHLDEPVGDPIIIPMYQLAREAKKKVTVVLTGEGADETLGGYLFHQALLSGERLARVVPAAVRRAALEPLLAATPAGLINLAFHYPASLGRRGKRKVQDFLALVGSEHLPEAYLHLISLFDRRDTQGLYSDEFRAALGTEPELPAEWTALDARAPFLNRVLHLQFAHWLQDDILTKQDKLSMASAIEARVPFLDHELVEYALRMPPRMKIRGGTNKLVLRRYAARRRLPPRITAKRKMPFYNPIERFVSHPIFQDFLEDALSEQRVRQRGLFRPEAVQALRRSLQEGEFVHVKQVFSLIVLELWFQMAVDRRGAA